MSRTTTFLIAGVMVPALALALAVPVAAAEQGGAIVVAQASTDPKPDPKNDPKKKPQQPAAQPAKPQQPAAKPAKPQPPAASAPSKPATTPSATTQPPASSQPSKPAQPAAREPAKPQHPTTAQPSTPSHPSTTGQPSKPAERDAKKPPHPTAAQPSTPSQPSATGQPSKPTQPAARDAAKPQHPTTAQPPAPSQPNSQPPTALRDPRAPNAAQPGATPQATGRSQPTTTAAPSKPVVPTPPPTRAAALESVKRAQEMRSRRVDDLHTMRKQTEEGGRTVIREPDRTIVVEGGRPIIRHSEVARFGFGARDMNVERRGSETWTVVVRPGGINVVTVVDDDGHVLRRTKRFADGREVVLIDNSFVERDRLDYFYLELSPPVIRIPRERYIVEAALADAALIYDALIAPPVEELDRRYALDEVLYNPLLLDRMPRIDIDTITFDTGSWEIGPGQAERLAVIADAINRVVARNPQEMFLIEGHTDAVGNDVDNLSLSDRRAESVASLLTEQFQVAPENMTTQGYGKQNLKIPTDGPERRNRRVTVRRITPLLNGKTASAER